MMVPPTKRERELREKVSPWLIFDAEKEEFCLLNEAPEDVKKAKKELEKIVERKRNNPFYKECG